MSNSLDPDQARHNVGPDLGPNCLKRLSADDTRRLRVNFQQFFVHCSLEAPLSITTIPMEVIRRGASTEYLQHIFLC